MSRPQKVNVRFIAATNEDLERMVKQKRFRKDLYYRLRGGWLHLPPLRERKDDILLLINHFVIKFCGPDGINIEEEVLATLRKYDYPGNIRELKSIIQSAVNLAHGKTITLKHLPENITIQEKFSNMSNDIEPTPTLTLKQMEKKYILNVYNNFGKNKSQAASALGIALNTLKSKLASYGVEKL